MIFVNSFPKAGTHLVSSILDILGFVEGIHIGARLVEPGGSLRRRIVYSALKVPGSSVYIGIDSPRKVNMTVLAFLSKVGQWDYVTAHLPHSSSGTRFFRTTSRKMLLVTRDPRSLVYSFVHYVRRYASHFMHDWATDIDDKQLIAAYLYGSKHEGHEILPLKARIKNFAKWQTEDGVLPVSFEDLVGENGGGTESRRQNALGTIQDFLEIRHATPTQAPRKKHTYRLGRVDSWRQELLGQISAEDMRYLTSCAELLGYTG